MKYRRKQAMHDLTLRKSRLNSYSQKFESRDDRQRILNFQNRKILNLRNRRSEGQKNRMPIIPVQKMLSFLLLNFSTVVSCVYSHPKMKNACNKKTKLWRKIKNKIDIYAKVMPF